MAFPVSPTNGQVYNNYYYDSTSNSWQFKSALDGSSKKNAAPSGYYLKNKYPTKPSGWYWIQSQFMPNPLYMYVDMTEEGGGYDFYPISSGISVKRVDVANSGTPLGLDFVYPRSKAHFKALRNFIVSTLGSTVSTYLRTLPVYRNVGLDSSGGTYVSYIMNSLYAPDWRVKDGGRWWLRDSVFTEPNGDYNYNNLLHMVSYDIEADGNLTGFNDYNESEPANTGCGANYIVSTNMKP